MIPQPTYYPNQFMQPMMQPYAPAYNPMLSAQQRLTQMEQQYPQFAPQQAQPQTMTQQPIQQSLTARAVTSKEEALGVPVDFSGALMVFTDVSHNRVYTKAFNTGTGSADFKEYVLSSPETPKSASETMTVVSTDDTYVTHKELNELIMKFIGGNDNADQSNDDGNQYAASAKSTSSESVSTSSTNAKRKNT